MKAFLFWITLTIGGSTFASAAEAVASKTHEKVTFLNFSDKSIELNWISPDDQTKRVLGVMEPYKPVGQKTFSGDTYSYEYEGTEYFFTVASTSKMYITNENANHDKLVHQTHIIGGLDFTDEKKVLCGSTKGDIHITVKPLWSPRGAARFLELLGGDIRYFDGCALNRVVPDFLVQFGIGASYEQRTQWRDRDFPDDPQLEPRIKFKHGYMSYAGSGDNSRSTEMFIAMPGAPKSQLRHFGTNPWETPFGFVEERDLGVVTSWYSYGDMDPWGKGPDPQKIYGQNGYDYLKKKFPDLDYLKGCVIIPDKDMDNPSVLNLSYEELADYVFDVEEEEL